MIVSFLKKYATNSNRWIALLLLSIALHLLAIEWIGGGLVMPEREPDDALPITAQVKFSKGEYFPFPIAAPPPPSALKNPKANPAHPPPPPIDTPPQPQAEFAVIAPNIVAGDEMGMDDQASDVKLGTEVPGTSIDDAVEIETSAVSAAPAAKPQPSAAPAVADAPQLPASELSPVAAPKLALPPSAELKYDVKGLYDGQTAYGSAKIRWRNEGDRYSIDGETSMMFFTLLSFKSEGSIDASGVAPLLYVEKKFRKPETNTHFHRERNTISFSASTLSYPRKGTEQDRASVIWQLAGLARGEPEKFLPHTEIELFVAGNRDGEPWQFQVIGPEQIEIDDKPVSTVHLVRIPRTGSYQQKLDIWLAPQQDWYPVRLRFTETNGDNVDMSLSKLSPLPPHSPQ